MALSSPRSRGEISWLIFSGKARKMNQLSLFRASEASAWAK
ncbi:MAG: hypothetical protein U5L45_09500 [Saprospiraceae bacterium]|nr:hypothetical protein [Saprospiraceae bacterium]